MAYAEMASNRSVYSRLSLPYGRKCFRLLQLHDGESGAPLVATMTVHDLGSWIEYEALSYCWGSTAPHSVVRVNEEDIMITDELYSALLQLRCEQKVATKAKKIWIDAMCIDQSNGNEKSHQINMMRSIYANATSVRAWLGPADRHTEIAFELFNQFALADGTPNGALTRQKLRHSPATRCIAITETLTRPYFERVWIVQEIVVARLAYLQCGSSRIDFDDFQYALRRMTGSGSYAFTPRIASLAYLGEWRDAFRRGEQSELGMRLLIDSRDRKATDQRDKLYSLRGIVSDDVARAIVVSYDKTVKEVYTDFSNAFLSTSSNLQLLSAVELGHRARTSLGLPSYVPDFSQPKLGGSVLQRYYRFRSEYLFRASGDTHSDVEVVPGGVSVRGFELDIVDRVFDMRPRLGSPRAYDINLAKLQGLASELVPGERYAFTNEAAWVAAFRTLTADRSALSPRVRDSYRTQFLSHYPAWVLTDSFTHEPESLPVPVWFDLSSDLADIIVDKVMFVTKKGYIGLGHDGVRDGDRLCIFFGGEVPFLVRGIKGDGGFAFLCEAYVHGLMDGEALEDRGDCGEEYYRLI